MKVQWLFCSEIKLVATTTLLLLAFGCGWPNLIPFQVEAAAPVKENQIVRHFVAFKFKESAKPEEIEEISKEFKALQQKISFIVSIENGANVSTEHLDKGFTHGFLVTFRNISDRDRYLVHPAHKSFVSSLKGSVDEAFVFDFSP